MQAQKAALEKFENCDGSKSQSLPGETSVFGVQLWFAPPNQSLNSEPALNLDISRCRLAVKLVFMRK
jgi:hypothetical protein